MKKVISLCLIVIGVFSLLLGLYFQKSSNNKRLEEKIDYSSSSSYDYFCEDFKAKTYELRAFNYTKALIKIPDCLENTNNSTFLREFANEKIYLKMEIINLKEDLSSYQKEGEIYFKLRKEDQQIIYKWYLNLDQDLFLSIEATVNNAQLSQDFIKTLLDYDYSKEKEEFLKTKEQDGEKIAQLLLTNYSNQKTYRLEIKLQEDFVEEALVYADQSLYLTNEEQRLEYFLLNDYNSSCQDILIDFNKIKEEDNYYQGQDDKKITYCKNLDEDIFLKINFYNFEKIDEKFLNYQLKN